MGETLQTMAEKACPACSGDVPPLKGEDLRVLHEPLGTEWQLVEEHHLVRGYKFPDFVQALAFTNVVGGIAEDVNHHPDILTAWGKVEVTIWTHKINGLTESDFVFAAKVEKAFQDAL